MNRRQSDNGREWQKNQENHPGQTPREEHTQGSSGGHAVLHDGVSSSYNPPNIQNHGRDATHGYTTHSQRYPYCSGRTGMHSQTAAACGLPAGHDDQKMDFTHSSEPVQFFTQESLLRSVQASTQMLYDVFDFTIGMLEELEKHEGHPGKRLPPNSGIFPHLVPLNHKKPEPEVIAGIEAELQCLSIQMRYLPKDVINDSTRKQMVEQTLKWLGAREELQVPRSIVERINSEQVNEATFQMARGRHFGEQQDQQFHKDPNKKAKLRPKRRTGMNVFLREGANRLPLDEHKDKALIKALEPYVTDLGVDNK
ncbi:uncharacterized protein LOC110238970 isoform X2 [Exaiptasia diaphana]|uniref:Uncharacterized protein n=1 Tax=Exaiptasia diaphana TaxID=2652724 RepID=A0A913X7Z3_EXADI|nr:uncharacterized protein LOC110238970 isoform X2 [Exaiptasia diaphana]KXJ14369.1 hypothetical protein AC249_AIPGENE5129 [Exaiptasia diaphana]